MRKLLGAAAALTLLVALSGAGLVTQSGPRHFASSSSSSSSSGGAAGFTPESGVYALSGTIGNGNSLTLTSSSNNFGTGPTIAKITHDYDAAITYAGGGLTEGDAIPVTASDPFLENTPLDSPGRVKYSTAVPRHSNQTANYKCSTRGTMDWPRSMGDNGPPNGQDTVYASVWLRRNTTGSAGGSQSNKIIRIWDDSEGTGTRISWGTENLTVSNGDGLNNTSGVEFVGIPPVGTWRLYELYADTDVEVLSYMDGELGGSYTGTFKDSGFTGTGLNVRLFGYDTGGSSPMDADWQMGDFYVADSRARVVIATASSWGAVTNAQELQTPTAWAAGSISFTNLYGQYGSSLSGKYLYVIKSDNTALRIGQFDMMLPLFFAFTRFRRRRAANDDAIEAWRKAA